MVTKGRWSAILKFILEWHFRPFWQFLPVFEYKLLQGHEHDNCFAQLNYIRHVCATTTHTKEGFIVHGYHGNQEQKVSHLEIHAKMALLSF